MFAEINSLADLLPAVQDNPQFRIDERADGYTIVCYMLKDEDTFGGEHAALKAECRGITFKDGKVVSRTLHKFANVGESEDTQPHLIPWHDIVRIMDKRDGSMITFVQDGEHVRAKTKKTFDSAEAIEATKLVSDYSGGAEWIKSLLRQGYTPTFEFTSPRFPIVLVYEKDELTLLQIRHNITGKYVMPGTDQWNVLTELCPFNIVPNLIDEFSWSMADEGIPSTTEVDWEKLKKAAEDRTGIEGWIIQASDGRMWKVKTVWYCNLHHSVTFTRYRDVAKLVLADQSDDLKAAFALTGRSIAPIVEIEHQIFSKIEEYEAIVREVVRDSIGLSFKEMALKLNSHPLFSQIMRVARGGEVDWLKFYEEQHLREHSLEVIPCAGLDDLEEGE